MTPTAHAEVLGFVLAVARSVLGCTLNEVWTMEVNGQVVRVRFALLPVDPRRTIMN